MNEEDFQRLLANAWHGRTVEVLAAVDLDVGLVNRVGQRGYTLLLGPPGAGTSISFKGF